MTTGTDTPPDTAQAIFADVRQWIGALGAALAGRPGDAFDRDGRNIGHQPQALSAAIADALTGDELSRDTVDQKIMSDRDFASRLWEVLHLQGAGVREALHEIDAQTESASAPKSSKRRRPDQLPRGLAVETLVDFSAVADHYNAQNTPEQSVGLNGPVLNRGLI